MPPLLPEATLEAVSRCLAVAAEVLGWALDFLRAHDTTTLAALAGGALAKPFNL
jgi:hypothetical protein